METDRLAKLIEQKREVLRQVHDLSLKQAEIVEQGDVSRLLNLLSAKQSFLDVLQLVEKQLDPFRSQDPDSRQWRTPEMRQQVRVAAEESDRLLQEIMRMERESETHLGHRRDAAMTRLQGVHSKTQARDAYLQQDHPASTGFDLTSDS